MDRATLSFLREVKRATLLATTALDFRIILVLTDNAVSARTTVLTELQDLDPSPAGAS